MLRRALKVVPLVLLCAVVVEIAVFVLLGRGIGFGWTVSLLVAVSALGLVLLRREGIRAWRGFRDALATGNPPGEQVTDGLVGLAAGVLLAVPGLVSGVTGLVLVVPPVRRVVRRRIQAAAERRVSAQMAGDLFGPRRVRVRRGEPEPEPAASEDVATGAGSRPSAAGPAIEGEIVEPRP